MATDWNERAETYPVEMRESLDLALEVVKKECGRFGTAADIGCGPGNMTYPLSGIFGKVWSSDMSPRMLDRVRRICGERGIANVETVLSDAMELELPGKCDLAFSSLCPGITGIEGLEKLDSLSGDLCVYVTHNPDEKYIDMTYYEPLGIVPFTRNRDVSYIEEFGKTHDITVLKVQDSTTWKSREEATERFSRMTDGSPEAKARVERFFMENDPTGTVTKNGKLVVYWHSR